MLGLKLQSQHPHLTRPRKTLGTAVLKKWLKTLEGYLTAFKFAWSQSLNHEGNQASCRSKLHVHLEDQQVIHLHS